MRAAEPDPRDPFAWQQWAAEQDPGLYGWQGRRAYDPTTGAGASTVGEAGTAHLEALLSRLAPDQRAEVERYMAVTQARTSYENKDYLNSETGAPPDTTPPEWDGPAPDLSALQGYSVEDARGPGHVRMSRLIGPDGNPVSGSEQAAYAPGDSLRHGDYADIAKIAAIAAAPYMSGALAGAGYSAAGAGAITGATVGGTIGGLEAGDVRGGIKGAAMGALAGGAMGGMQGSNTDALAYGDASQYAGAPGAAGEISVPLSSDLGEAIQYQDTGGVMNTGATSVDAAPRTADWGRVGQAALRNAATDAGLTLARGGKIKDALKAGAVGALSAGAGSLASQYGAGQFLSGLAAGGVRTLATGGDASTFARGALAGGVGQLAGNYAGNAIDLGPTSRSAVAGGVAAALRGGSSYDIMQGAASGALNAQGRADASPAERAPGNTGEISVPLSSSLGGPIQYQDGGGVMNVGAHDSQGGTMAYDDYGSGDPYNPDPRSFDPGAAPSDYGTQGYVGIEQWPDDSSPDAEPSDPNYSHEGRGSVPPEYSHEGNNYPTPESTVNSPVNSTPTQDSSSGVDWITRLFGGGGGQQGGGGGYTGSSAFVSDMLRLFGAGMNQASIEKAAKENREWLAAQDAAKRRRQAPTGALVPMTTTVTRGGR